MRKLVAILAMALGATSLGAITEVRADDPPATKPEPKPEPKPTDLFEGTYAPINPKAAEAAIHDAIEDVVKEMNIIKRPFARSKLRATNALLTRVQLQFQGDRLTYTYNGAHTIHSTVNGPEVRWKSPADGEFYQVRSTLKGRRFTLSFRGEGGAKQEVFEMGADGNTLVYRAIVTSPQLPKNLQFTYPLKRR